MYSSVTLHNLKLIPYLAYESCQQEHVDKKSRYQVLYKSTLGNR